MDNLHSYINNMFADFPEGPNKENLKYRVLRESEDRYRALQAEGHSDAEALGLVIQELDADEIRRRFDAEESTYRDYATRGFGDNPAADYARKFENKQRVRTILSTMLWPVTTITYLLMGFLGGLWHPGWLIFPIAAVLQRLIFLI